MPDSSWQDLACSPINGINLEDNDSALEQGLAVDSSNILYYGKQFYNRPGLTQLTTTMGQAAQFGWGLYLGDVPPATSSTPIIVLIGASDGKIYKIASNGTATEITGAGTTFGPKTYHNLAVVNGAILFGNNTGGLLRWDPAGTAYTILSAAKMRYVTGHFSRAVAAFDLNGNALTGPRTIKWSKPGDEAVWDTSPSTDGSGKTILSDAPDDITGISNLHNVVAVCRRTGFHLGYPTGNSSSAFRWESWSYKSVGVHWPGLSTTQDNTLYFVGRDDVYSFDLVKVTSIGYQIKSSLLAELIGGATFCMFCSRGIASSKSRQYLHIFPLSGSTNHYVFDLLGMNWSKHLYTGKVPSYGFAKPVGTYGEAASFVDTSNPPKVFNWDEQVICESPASISGPISAVGGPAIDAEIQRTLLKLRRYNSTVTLTLTADLAGSPVTSTQAQATPAGNDGKWTRVWFENRLTGQLFQAKIEILANERFVSDGWLHKVSESGRFRG